MLTLRSRRIGSQTGGREALREICRESTGARAPPGPAFDALEVSTGLKKRAKLPLVDDPPGEVRSFEVSCSEVEPEPFPKPVSPACTNQLQISVPKGRRVITGRDATIGEIFRQYGGQYLKQHERRLSDEQKQVLQELSLCRTEALGWSDFECEDCGCTHRACNPCRNRHCPQCEGHVRRQWLARHRKDLLNLPYYHVVLTTPHEINVLADDWRNLRTVYNALFWAARCDPPRRAQPFDDSRRSRDAGGTSQLVAAFNTPFTSPHHASRCRLVACRSQPAGDHQ